MATITNNKNFPMVWSTQGNKPLRLASGESEVNDKEIEYLSSHPVFKDYLKRGWITVMKDVTKEIKVRNTAPLALKHKEEEEDLENLSLRDLIKTINDMTDKEQLEKFAQDSRKRVSEAAKQQLSVLV